MNSMMVKRVVGGTYKTTKKIIHDGETDVETHPSPSLTQSGPEVRSFEVTGVACFASVTRHRVAGCRLCSSHYLKSVPHVRPYVSSTAVIVILLAFPVMT